MVQAWCIPQCHHDSLGSSAMQEAQQKPWVLGWCKVVAGDVFQALAISDSMQDSEEVIQHLWALVPAM